MFLLRGGDAFEMVACSDHHYKRSVANSQRGDCSFSSHRKKKKKSNKAKEPSCLTRTQRPDTTLLIHPSTHPLTITHHLTMSDSTVKRVKVSKPEKKKSAAPATKNTTSTGETVVEVEAEPLIDIPAIKKKKERRVKSEDDIAAKQERKRLRKEAEEVKKGAAFKKASVQNKTPKWKQFLKNSSEADNAEQLKDTSYKVKGDDGSDDDDEDSDSESEKANKKRKADRESEGRAKKETKKGKKEDDGKLAALDISTPGTLS